MEKIDVIYNSGRWIAICPRCLQADGVVAASEVRDGDVFVCPRENDGLAAMMLMPHPTKAGAFRSLPDLDARQSARDKAINAGNGYELVFPVEKAEIERILRYRPIAARNWRPGVSLTELQDENKRRGVKHD